MAERDYFPEHWMLYLQKQVAGFKALTPAHQRALARMSWETGSRGRRHAHFEGASTFSHTWLARHFGRGGFKVINDRLQMFAVSDQWFSKRGKTKGYWLTDDMQAVKEHYLRRLRTGATRLLTMDGHYMRTVPGAVASKDSDNITTTAWRNAKGLNLARIDMDGLRQLQRWAYDTRRAIKQGLMGLIGTWQSLAQLERIEASAGLILRMADTDVAGRGVLMTRYVQATSGRLYAKGISLQNAPKPVKDAALAGHWEYDISNCHYAILVQMAARAGYQCTAITEYLASKKATRQAIATEADITESQAKMCLLAIMYGARASSWHENAIPAEIGKDAAQRLYKVEAFAAIHQDVKQARLAILKAWPRTANGSLTNDFGRAIGSKATAEEKLAHLIQGVEAKALHTVIHMHSGEIVLVQHDGFTANRRLDCRAIEAAIERETGYRLELEEAMVLMHLDDYFDRKVKSTTTNRIQNENRRKPNAGAGFSLPLVN